MSRYVSPVFQIDDINGFSQVGAKLVFYTPGTTNLKTIYSDSGFTTPITNPVTSVSSNAGAIYPNIYLDGLYDVVQQDATGTVDTDDGAVIWTRDDVGETSTGPFTLWDTGVIYAIPEIVLGSDDEYYRSLTDANQGNNPISSLASWEQLRFGRIWNTNVTYAIGDSVYGSDGRLYNCLVSQSGNDPTGDVVNWDKYLTPTSPVLNTSVSGTAFLDDNTMATATATTFSSSESIKAYVDTGDALNAPIAAPTFTGLIKRSVSAGLTADAGSAQGGTPLTSDINEVSTVGTIGDSVTLPTAVAGLWVLVINNGANNLDLFPASGDNLGSGVDTAAAIGAGSRRLYASYDSTNWLLVSLV